MAQPKIKQINGLTAALAAKVATASNVGAGSGLFKQKSGTDLEFYTLATDSSVVPSAPATNIISLGLEVKNISGEVTAYESTDRIPIMDDSDAGDATKYITVGNLLTGLAGGPVDFADYSADTSVDADSIIFFDNSASDTAKIETKSAFLSGKANLASPTFTGTPAAPTAASGTSTTQLATTQFVMRELTSLQANTEWLPNALDVQTDSSLDPGATPAAGDVYIITNAAALHANFGTIDTDTEGNATTLANNDVVQHDGSEFLILFDASEEGEGAFCYVEDVNQLYVFTTSWNALDTGEITAGNGLTKTGLDLSVNVDDSTIEINADTLRIKTTWAGSTSLTTLGTITTGTWNGTAIGVVYGGLGLTSVAANEIPYGSGSNTYSKLAVGSNTFVGNSGSGVAALSKSTARQVLGLRPVTDTGTATAGSMTLMTLSQTPDANSEVQITFNGIELLVTTDYTISGTTVTATSALNVAYGGTSTDGNGFENSDVIIARYTY